MSFLAGWFAGVAAVAMALLVSSCAHRAPYALSAADAKRFGTNVVRMTVAGRAEPVILGLDGCEVQRAQIAHGEIVGWKTILGADGSYPRFLTVCTHQSISYDGKYVWTFLCAQAIGAGGGCANGGNYRSADSVRWEKQGVRGVFHRAPFP
jgi:hypothetical protein